MKKIIDTEKGFKLSKKNFRKLYTASKQASALRNYGLACSLNILASEELIKSFVIHLKYLHPEINFINSDKIFCSHKFKHDELKSFIKTTHEGLDIFTFNILEDKEQFLSLLPEDKVDEYKKEYKDIERVKRRTNYIRKFKVEIDEIFTWLDKANDEKNLGLYVNYDKKIKFGILQLTLLKNNSKKKKNIRNY